MPTVFRFRPEDFPFWSRRFPGGALAASVFAAWVVEAIGFLLVGNNIRGGKTFADHTVIQFEIKTVLLDKRHRQIVQINLAESPDKQTQHADRTGGMLISEDLIDEHQVGA